MKYEDAIKLITGKSNFYIDLGLDRISAVLDKFGNPENSLKFIHVAGTNGKGSVCTMLASILQEAGYKTGLYTSPHIWEYTERIKVNGADIPKETFAEYVQMITGTGIHLTEFEILTVMMFLYFKEKNVDTAVLETGLGGRLDATNVIKQNLCSIITHIDLDHTDRLGNTKDKIAYEKAGIIKKGCPVITAEGYEAVRDKADECGSMFILTNPYVNPEFIDALALKGNQQVENLALVINAVNYLLKDIDDKTIIEGLKKVKNPCRFEYIQEKNLIIDASHNPNGIEALRDNLDWFFPREKRRFVFGCLKNKDYKKMMEILFEKRDEIYFYHFNNKNSCTVDELQEVCEFPSKQFTSLEELPDDYLKIVCGSFYMLNEIIPQSLVR